MQQLTFCFDFGLFYFILTLITSLLMVYSLQYVTWGCFYELKLHKNVFFSAKPSTFALETFQVLCMI